jgi:hypothetical protein
MTEKTVMKGDMKLRPFACKADLEDGRLGGILQFVPLDQQHYSSDSSALPPFGIPGYRIVSD